MPSPDAADRSARLCHGNPGTAAYHDWAERRQRITRFIGGLECCQSSSRGTPDPDGEWWFIVR
jgi:hypothetical protein